MLETPINEQEVEKAEPYKNKHQAVSKRIVLVPAPNINGLFLIKRMVEYSNRTISNTEGTVCI